MKVIIDRHIPYLYERVSQKCETLMLDPSQITPETIADADALIVRTRTRCNSSLLENSAVKLVATATIGFDHIDRQWCETRGISTSNAAGCNAPAVVQYVTASLSRAGFDPKIHTLGIVGKGHIGSILAETVRAAGGKVLVCDPPRKEDGYMDELYLDLADMLPLCDAVTFHVPLTEASTHPTRHLLNEGNISLLKPGAIVVNAARGGVIDEETALRLGTGIRWIIDTWEGEPNLNRDFLKQAFLATPHIAGYSEEGKQRATRRMIEALNRHFNLDIDVSGLADYDYDPQLVDFKKISDSFDPLPEDSKLRSNPEAFEVLRDSYKFRPEPLTLSKNK